MTLLLQKFYSTMESQKLAARLYYKTVLYWYYEYYNTDLSAAWMALGVGLEIPTPYHRYLRSTYLFAGHQKLAFPPTFPYFIGGVTWMQLNRFAIRSSSFYPSKKNIILPPCIVCNVVKNTKFTHTILKRRRWWALCHRLPCWRFLDMKMGGLRISAPIRESWDPLFLTLIIIQPEDIF